MKTHAPSKPITLKKDALRPATASQKTSPASLPIRDKDDADDAPAR